MRIVKHVMKLKPSTWYKIKDVVRLVLKKNNKALVYHNGFEQSNLREWNES